jgi:hypothetical protein
MLRRLAGRTHSVGMSRILRLAAAIAAVLPLVAAPPPTAATKAPAKTVQLSDAQIEKDLRARLSRSKLASQKFQFKVQGGIATIEGKTDVIQHKGVMTRMAKAAGARAVNNHIEISEAARRKAGAKLKEGQQRAQIHRQTPAPTR